MTHWGKCRLLSEHLFALYSMFSSRNKIYCKTMARQLLYRRENVLVFKIVEMSIFQKVVLRFIQALIRNHYTF